MSSYYNDAVRLRALADRMVEHSLQPMDANHLRVSQDIYNELVTVAERIRQDLQGLGIGARTTQQLPSPGRTPALPLPTRTQQLVSPARTATAPRLPSPTRTAAVPRLPSPTRTGTIPRLPSPTGTATIPRLPPLGNPTFPTTRLPAQPPQIRVGDIGTHYSSGMANSFRVVGVSPRGETLTILFHQTVPGTRPKPKKIVWKSSKSFKPGWYFSNERSYDVTNPFYSSKFVFGVAENYDRSG